MSRATAVSVAIVAVAVLAFTLSFGLPGYSQGGPPGRAQVPAVQAWQQWMDLEIDPDASIHQLPFNIPPGKRLVLEHVSAGLTLLTNQTPLVQFWGSIAGTPDVPHTIHVEKVGPWANENQWRWTGSHPMKIYVDSGLLRVTRVGGVAGPVFASVGLSGYLVDLP